MIFSQIPYQGNINYLETVNIEANHNSISDVICPFPPNRKKRSAYSPFVSGYKIAMSNNGKTFSQSHFMYILDSTCQDIKNISGELGFVLKVCFCLIVILLKINSHFQNYSEVYSNMTANVSYLCHSEKVRARNV